MTDVNSSLCSFCGAQGIFSFCLKCPGGGYCSTVCLTMHEERVHFVEEDDPELTDSDSFDEVASESSTTCKSEAGRIPLISSNVSVESSLHSSKDSDDDSVKDLSQPEATCAKIVEEGSYVTEKEVCATPAPKEAETNSLTSGREIEGLLTRRQLHALASDSRIRNEVRTPELQTLLKTIDSSRSRLDVLETAEYNIPEFSEFLRHVSQAIYMHP